MIDQPLFTNCVRSLFNIDGYLLPELTSEQQSAFLRDPVRYFIGTDKAQQDAIFREVAKRQPREKPVAPAHWNGFGKYGISFGFEPGGMNIDIAGYGEKDGDGVFWFAENDLEVEDNDGKQYRWVGVPNSELLAIRDKLNEVFPPAAQVSA